MSTLIHFHLGAFVHVAVSRLVALIRTVRLLVADQTLVNAVPIGAHELSRVGAGGVLHFRRTSILVRMIPTVILTIATELFSDALVVMTSELLAGARLVLGVAELSFVTAVATIIIMVAQPIHIQATTIVAGELIFFAGLRRRTMVLSHILVSPVNTIRLSIAQPFFGNTLRPVPNFVRGAGELCLFVTLSVIALVSIVLVRVIHAIVVPVADVTSGYTVAIVAGKQISEASSTLRLTVIWRFIAGIRAVVVSIAVPCGWDAPVVRAPEAVLRTSFLGAVQRILIAIIPAIVITIAKPVGFHADVGLVAFQMIRGTCGVHGTAFVGLVGGDIVPAVVDTITDQIVRDATIIGAGELTNGARGINAAFLVAAVATVVLVIAFPGLEDAPAVVASELVGAARVVDAVIFVFVGAISAIVVAIAGPHPGGAATIPTGKLVGVAGDVLGHAHSVLVHEPAVVVALALDGPVHARMTGLIAATVRDVARIHFALLPVRRVNVQIPWRVVQPFHQLHLVGTGVLLRAIDSSQLEVRPVDMFSEDGYGEGVYGRTD